MGRDDEIRRAGMDLEIVYPDVRQIAQPHPMRAAIDGSKQTKVRSGIEEAGVDRVLPHYFHRVVRRKALPGDALPSLAHVGGAENDRAIVPGAVGVGHDVGDLGVFRAGLDPHDPLPTRRFGQLLRQFAPVSAVILRQPETAVVRSRPEKAGFDGRLG